MIEFHNPQAEVQIESVPYDLSFKLTSNNSATVGLLANGFPDSENFLTHIADVLREQQPTMTLRRFNKGNPSIPASEKILKQITSECQVVITAYGH